MFPDGGSSGLRGWGGLREKAARNEGAGRSGRFGRNSRNNRRGCALPPPGSGRMPGTGTCRGCGNRAASEPMTCVVCRGSGRAGVGVDGVCCVGVGGACRVAIAGCRTDLMGAEGCKKVCADETATLFVWYIGPIPFLRSGHKKRGPRIPAGIGAPLVRLVRLMRSGRFPRCDTQR